MDKGARSRIKRNRVPVISRVYAALLAVCALLVIVLIAGASSSGPGPDNKDSSQPKPGAVESPCGTLRKQPRTTNCFG